MRLASPDGARPGLHAEPLDVAIGECRYRIAPAAAMVIDGADTTNTTKNTIFS